MNQPRFRFRLRSLFIATAMFAVCIAWLVKWWDSRTDFVILTMGGSTAMEPFIDGRTYLAIDMNAYRRASPQRWEAVVFHLKQPTQPGRAPTASILRVVGLEGETIAFEDGSVVINGKALNPPPWSAPHLQNVQYRLKVPLGKVKPHPYTVPEGHYYVLGDNPDAANDSRLWGALPGAEILSRYPTQVEPIRPWPRNNLRFAK